MLRRLFRRVYLDRDRGRLWVDGSWHPVYRLNDGYICHNLSVKQLSSVRMEDLPQGLLIKDIIPLKLRYAGATLYVERDRMDVYVEVGWSDWPYAVGRGEFEERLTHVLKNLGYEVKLYKGGVRAAITCSGELSPYLGGLLEGLEGFRSWVLELHESRVQEARRMLEKISYDGRYLAGSRNLPGIARMLVASLTRDDIAYLLLGSDAVNSYVKPIVFREMGMDEGGVYERLRVLGLYRRAGEGLRASWPFPLISLLTKNLYSSWGGGVVVSQYLNAHHLMAYIYRNLYPLVVRDSRYGRDIGWRHGLKKFLEERLYPSLTFIDVAVTASLCLGIQPPLDRLRESLETLKDLGILSENLKPKPYATEITRLGKGYMVKTELVKKPRERREWENILGWRTLTNLELSKKHL